MAGANRRPTPAQREILDLVWEHGPCTVTFVWERLRERREVARNTVLTQLQRLEKAGWLETEEEGRAHLYRVKVPRRRLQQERARALLDQLFQGSAEGLVLSLVEDGALGADELARLRAVLAEEEERLRREEDRT